jgi:predicted Zn-dependent protease
VLDHFEPLLAQHPADEVAALACSQAYAELEDYPVAVAVLQRSLAQQVRPAVRNTLGSTYVRWVQATARKTPPDLGTELRILEESLRQVPNEPGLLQALLDLGRLPGAEAERARGLLERQLTQGPPSALLHLMLGLDAYRHEQNEAARIHLEQAYQLSPEAPLISNNLACILMRGPNPDLQRALALVDSALQAEPHQPHFRETRGQILVKLGRYREALNDLETARRDMPATVPLHLALATTYEKLGMATLAEEHRRLATPKPSGQP